VEELVKLLTRLLTKTGTEQASTLQKSILSELVNALPEVLAEANTLVFSQILGILTNCTLNLTPNVCNSTISSLSPPKISGLFHYL